MNLLSPRLSLLLFLSIWPPTVAPAGDELITRVYRVPATFFHGPPPGGRGTDDPFAQGTARTGLELMKSVGIAFLEGASAVYLPSKQELIVRNTRSQHDLLETYLESLAKSGEQQLHIVVEFIEVPHEKFSDWLFENRLHGDGSELRRTVQDWVKAGQGTILETAVVNARSGHRAKTEGVSEWLYPVDFDPPEVPTTLELSGGSQNIPPPPNAAAFECRNLGITLETDPVLGPDGNTVDLNLLPEIVSLQGTNHWPSEKADPEHQTSTPIFYTMRISTQVTLIDGRYGFLGTTRPHESSDPERKDPIVLVFARADIGAVQNWSVREPVAGEEVTGRGN